MEKQNKRLVSKNAIVTTAVLLTIFAVAGIQLLSIFGISIFSFMVVDGRRELKKHKKEYHSY
jgi:multiple antibiotic resistance protein